MHDANHAEGAPIPPPRDQMVLKEMKEPVTKATAVGIEVTINFTVENWGRRRKIHPKVHYRVAELVNSRFEERDIYSPDDWIVELQPNTIYPVAFAQQFSPGSVVPNEASQQSVGETDTRQDGMNIIAIDFDCGKQAAVLISAAGWLLRDTLAWVIVYRHIIVGCGWLGSQGRCLTRVSPRDGCADPAWVAAAPWGCGTARAHYARSYLYVVRPPERQATRRQGPKEISRSIATANAASPCRIAPSYSQLDTA